MQRSLLMVPAGGVDGKPAMSSPPGQALAFPPAWRRRSQISPQGVPGDEEVMARLQSNQSEALRIFFDRYSRLVFGIAWGVLRDSGEAEDVLQEVFLYLYRKAKLFDGSKGSVKNWIGQIALHRALDRKLHLARRGFYGGTDLSSLNDMLPGDTDLDREIGSKLNRVQLERAFQQLPEIQRQTLVLFYFEGLDLREISEKLNEPFGNTRHHFYRGLERLRKSAFVQRLREPNRCPTTATAIQVTQGSEKSAHLLDREA
jgi:RNA polymerase sigma-70 factor, ECF subfamily